MTTSTTTTAPRSLTARFAASVARTRSDIGYASRRIIELQTGTGTQR